MLARPGANMRSGGLTPASNSSAAVHARSPCAVATRRVVAHVATHRSLRHQVVQLLARQSVVLRASNPEQPATSHTSDSAPTSSSTSGRNPSALSTAPSMFEEASILQKAVGWLAGKPVQLPNQPEGARFRYVIDLDRVVDRVDKSMYKHVEAVTAKWTPRCQYDEFTAKNGDVDRCPGGKILYNTVQKKVYCKPKGGLTDTHLPLYCVMSSALMMYRLCCLFEGLHIRAAGQSGYKVAWEAEVQHAATGEVLHFSEWKGAAHVRVSNSKGPKLFHDDVLELLNLIYDERCPHPYDGTVAGTVA